MDEFVMYKLLDSIYKKETISVMFKLGYSYSSVIKWFSDLENLGYIFIEDDVSKFITQKGENKLVQLEKNIRIVLLENWNNIKLRKCHLKKYIYLDII